MGILDRWKLLALLGLNFDKRKFNSRSPKSGERGDRIQLLYCILKKKKIFLNIVQ
jgi:hypothetical protein